VRLDVLVSADSGFETIVWRTLNWAQREGRIVDLIAAAQEWVPSNKKLQKLSPNIMTEGDR
jgi:hypothetical protein